MIGDRSGGEYSAFAAVYDEWQRSHGVEYCLLVAPRVNDRLQQTVGRPRLLIDLACGTGTHALLQAHGGTRVVGVDISAGMLAIARGKARGSRKPVSFEQADMRSFDVEKPADAVTCLYASLNHLRDSAELTATFARVAAHLRPGGVLIFDVNTRDDFEVLWREAATDTGPGFTIQRRYEWRADDPWTTMYLTIEREVEGSIQRSSDSLRARWFEDRELAGALTQAGLIPRETTPFNPFPEVPGGAIKQLWTAIRPK